MKKILAVILFPLLLCCLSACTKSSSSSDSGEDTSPVEIVENDGAQLQSACGLVLNGQLLNAPEASIGVLVSIDSIISSNIIVIKRESGPQVVKLHGIGNDLPPYKLQAAINMLENLPAQAIFVQESVDCQTTFSNVGIGVVGQLFTPQGESFGEKLLKAGLASVDANDVCNGNLLTACYNSILGVDAPALSYEDVGAFLWKPVSDKDGNLVIHVGWYDARVVVNGSEGEDRGPGNGFGSTARFSRPGCAYGKNVRVELFDRNSGAPLAIQGKHPYIVADGCQRVEIR